MGSAVPDRHLTELRPSAHLQSAMVNAEVRFVHRVLRQQSHYADLRLMASDFDHLAFYDQMMFSVDGGLNVVADRPGSFASLVTVLSVE